MTPQALLDRLRASGIMVTITADGQLHLEGDDATALPPDLEGELRQHRAALVALLEPDAGPSAGTAAEPKRPRAAIASRVVSAPAPSRKPEAMGMQVSPSGSAHRPRVGRRSRLPAPPLSSADEAGQPAATAPIIVRDALRVRAAVLVVAIGIGVAGGWILSLLAPPEAPTPPPPPAGWPYNGWQSLGV